MVEENRSHEEGGRQAGDGTHSLGKSELRSIAVYCEHTNCKMPKEVSSHLQNDGTNAAMATAFLSIAAVTSVGLGVMMCFFLGLDNFDLLRFINFNSLSWFVRGHLFACAVIGILFWSMLLGALQGLSLVTAGGIVGVTLVVGSLYFSVFLMSDVLVDNVVGGSVAFAIVGFALCLLFGLVLAFLVR